jgi:selenocysteine lyase/cysteine desulfurase
VAHGNGAILIVDATQSARQVPIDVTASGADVLICGSYKWLCSTCGAAICPSLLGEFRPPMVGWRSTSTPTPWMPAGFPWPPLHGGWSNSTMSYAAAIALGRAIGYVSGQSLA